MRLLLMVLFTFSIMNTQAQSFEKYNDDNTGELIYKGRITFNDLHKEGYFRWFIPGVDMYQPDEEAMQQLKPQLKKYNIVVLMGTWCEDSHNLIPKLYKVLQQSNYPLSKLTMYGLDRDKQGLNNEQQKYGVKNIPAIIVYNGDREQGRITETVSESVEADLLNIIENAEEGYGDEE